MKQMKKKYITFFSNGFPKSQNRTCVPVVCLSVASSQVGGIRTSGVTVGILKMVRARKAGSPIFVTSTSICRVGCSPRTNSFLQFRRHNSKSCNKNLILAISKIIKKHVYSKSSFACTSDKGRWLIFH